MSHIQLKSRKKRGGWIAPESKELPVRYALPYYKSKFGSYTHRIRYGTTHIRKGETTHVSLEMWCGHIGILSPDLSKSKGKMTEQPDPDAIICATCEGKAIGAGMDGIKEINGRKVIFSPRK